MLHHQETLPTSPFLPPRHLDSPKENRAGECAAAAAKLIRTEGKPGNNIVRRTNAPAELKPSLRHVRLFLIFRTLKRMGIQEKQWSSCCCCCFMVVEVENKTQHWGFSKNPELSRAARTRFIHLLCHIFMSGSESPKGLDRSSQRWRKQPTFSLWKALHHLHVLQQNTPL